MAIDCVGDPSKDVRDFQALEKHIARREEFIRDKKEERSLLGRKPRMPTGRFRSIDDGITDAEAILKDLKARRKKLLKKMCPDCEGNQWDPNSHGQMAHSCHGCGGSGLMKDHQARQKERMREMESHFKKNPLLELQRTASGRVKPGTIRQPRS